MTISIWLKAGTLWLAILVLAILNGLLRETLLFPAFGSTAAYLASGLILTGCIFAVAFAAAPWYGRLQSRRWLSIGLAWLVFTLVFEFGFGLFVQQKPLSEVLAAYTFHNGNLWPLVLVITGMSPWLAARVRGYI